MYHDYSNGDDIFRLLFQELKDRGEFFSNMSNIEKVNFLKQEYGCVVEEMIFKRILERLEN